jgi:hypothetical protein
MNAINFVTSDATDTRPRLSQSAMLATLKVSAWSARKLDKAETRLVSARHGLAWEGLANVNKNLLPGANALDLIKTKTGEVRLKFYTETLPWNDQGSRILPARSYLRFQQEIGAMLEDWRSLVDGFVRIYPTLRENAKSHLNTLFNATDYPDAREIEAKFNIDMRFMPMPDAGDWRVALDDGEISKLRAKVEADMRAVQEHAMRDVWARVKDVVDKATERLAQPDAVFRDSLVSNARELVELMPALNLTNDPALEQVRVALENSLASTTPHELRNVPSARRETVRSLGDIEKKFGAFFAAAS